MAPTKKTYFQEAWTKNPQYFWVEADITSKNYAKCNVCHKTINLSNMGEKSLSSHAKSQLHVDKLQQLSINKDGLNLLEKFIIRTQDTKNLSLPSIISKNTTNLISTQITEACHDKGKNQK